MPVAVEFYDVSVAIHVMAAIAAFGPLLVFPLFIAAAERRDPAALPVVLRAVNRSERLLVVPATAVVGLTGIYAAVEGPFEFGKDKWMDIGFGLYLLVFGLLVFLVEPMREKAAEEVDRFLDDADDGELDVHLSPTYRRRMRFPNMLMPAFGVVLLFVVYLMEVKPASG